MLQNCRWSKLVVKNPTYHQITKISKINLSKSLRKPNVIKCVTPDVSSVDTNLAGGKGLPFFALRGRI